MTGGNCVFIILLYVFYGWWESENMVYKYVHSIFFTQLITYPWQLRISRKSYNY
jgi:hypothetical protein